MKRDHSRVHPDLRPIAQRTPAFLFSRKTLWLTKRLVGLTPPPHPPEDILIQNRFILSGDQQQKTRVRIYRPKSAKAPTPAMVWMHGGGYVMGTPEMDEWRCVGYAREAGITVVSVDYRLAPKHPFPAALMDCYDALIWVDTNSGELGIDTARIAVGGASAGGGLAAAMAQMALDRQMVTPVFQLLVYPMLDDRTALRMDLDDSDNFTWNQENNRYAWESYLGRKCGSDGMPAYSVPARREDLSGLPPTWIGVGSLDIFHDENMEYGNRLKVCGVDCTTHLVTGAFHGFDVFDRYIGIVREFWKAQVFELKNNLRQLT
ncbi:MAG: alpha/beta hydrolase [Anaerolineaceae bacterium]|nr:alpha/beta hydrolase [Anaerolineaceae bacterium]